MARSPLTPAYRLSRDIAISFHGHNVRAKVGTPVNVVRGGGFATGYTINPVRVETDSPIGRGTMWEHDTTYYFIWVPTDAVEAVPE